MLRSRSTSANGETRGISLLLPMAIRLVPIRGKETVNFPSVPELLSRVAPELLQDNEDSGQSNYGSDILAYLELRT